MEVKVLYEPTGGIVSRTARVSIVRRDLKEDRERDKDREDDQGRKRDAPKPPRPPKNNR